MRVTQAETTRRKADAGSTEVRLGRAGGAGTNRCGMAAMHERFTAPGLCGRVTLHYPSAV